MKTKTTLKLLAVPMPHVLYKLFPFSFPTHAFLVFVDKEGWHFHILGSRDQLKEELDFLPDLIKEELCSVILRQALLPQRIDELPVCIDGSVAFLLYKSVQTVRRLRFIGQSFKQHLADCLLAYSIPQGRSGRMPLGAVFVAIKDEHHEICVVYSKSDAKYLLSDPDAFGLIILPEQKRQALQEIQYSSLPELPDRPLVRIIDSPARYLWVGLSRLKEVTVL